MIDLLQYENSLIKKGHQYICGIDEAGRGPLAGPVMIGAAVMDLSCIIEGINDSKQLSEKERNNLYPRIKECAIGYTTVAVSHEDIDRINILNATKRGMIRAAELIFPSPDCFLIDAVKETFPAPSYSLIKGDCVSYSIACASILAKVERDELMLEYAEMYPEYGFEKHKGYGTKLHIERLKKYGPCPIHRKTFIRHFISEV